jgi:hypothetical protein
MKSEARMKYEEIKTIFLHPYPFSWSLRGRSCSSPEAISSPDEEIASSERAKALLAMTELAFLRK